MKFKCWKCGETKDGTIYTWPSREARTDHLICGGCFDKLYRWREFIDDGKGGHIEVTSHDAPPEPNREKYPLEDFIAMCNQRLEKGAIEYGPDSYLHNDVIREMEEELVDFANWTYLQWAKVQRVKELWKELCGLMGTGGV